MFNCFFPFSCLNCFYALLTLVRAPSRGPRDFHLTLGAEGGGGAKKGEGQRELDKEDAGHRRRSKTSTSQHNEPPSTCIQALKNTSLGACRTQTRCGVERDRAWNGMILHSGAMKLRDTPNWHFGFVMHRTRSQQATQLSVVTIVVVVAIISGGFLALCRHFLKNCAGIERLGASATVGRRAHKR